MSLTFRKVALADRPAMLDICATVWDGHDYLPYVFDQWATIGGGQFTAVEAEGKIVALAKLTQLAPGEFWLEGIRVHPDYRGRGVAAALHDYHLDLWRRIGGPGTLRLVTDSESNAIIKLCERTGFQRIFEFTFAQGPAEAAPSRPHRFARLAPDETEQAVSVVQHVPIYDELHHLCELDLGWKWRELTPRYLAERAAAGMVYRWGDWEAVLVILLPTERYEPQDILGIQFAAVAPERRVEFLAEVRALAWTLGKMRVGWSPLGRAAWLSQLPQAGYTRTWEGMEYCFEIRQ